MADCDTPTISLPDITCLADLRTWGVQAEAALQAAVDHIIGCILDVEIPEMDICKAQDDLVECPIPCDSINFEGITWGDEGDVCQMPLPPTLGDYEFRHGVDTIGGPYGNAWRSTTVTFSTPFTTTCLWVGVTVEKDEACSPVVGAGPGACISGVDIDADGYDIVVQDYTATGCTVWIFRRTIECDCRPVFRYFAIGH